jgi:hypothetical protein
MSIRTILVASILASLGAIAGQESAALAQPVLPPPPAPMYQPQPEPEPAYPSPAPSYAPQQQQPAPAAPAAPAYPPPQQPAQAQQPAQQPAQAYPPPAQQPAQAYPAPAQPAPAYPPPQQPATGYPQPDQGYPQQPQAYPPAQPQQPQAYPPQQPQTYPPQQPQAYPPQQPQTYPPKQPQTYPPQQPQTYPPQQPQQQGYPPPQPQAQGYPPQQPQGYPPPQPQAQPAPQQDLSVPAPAPKSESIFSDPLSKLQVGFHLGTGSLTADNRTYDSDLTSLGIFARYRFNHRWEAELAVASESGTVTANGAQREFKPITASALLHAFNLRGVDVYGRLGLGRATEVYNNPAFRPLEGPTTHFHLGAGATYVFRRNIGAGLEMRWQTVRRGATDEISALNASGMAYSLFGAYHF